MQNIKNVGLLGGGVIGGGWAARFLINGKNVTLYDPAPDAEAKVREVLDNALTAYHRLTLAPVALRGELKVVSSVAEAVADAGFVQESAPEREDLKRSLLAEASRAAGPEVVIASSSSGLLPSRIQADCVGGLPGLAGIGRQDKGHVLFRRRFVPQSHPGGDLVGNGGDALRLRPVRKTRELQGGVTRAGFLEGGDAGEEPPVDLRQDDVHR